MSSRTKSKMFLFKWELLSTALLCWGTVYFALQGGSLWIKSLGVNGHMKATEQYFPVVLFILLYKAVRTFDKHKSNCKMPTRTRLPPQYLKWWVLKFRLGTHVPTPRGPRWMEWRIQGRGPGSPPPLIFRPNTNFFGDQALPLSKGSGWPGPPLAQGLDSALGCQVSKLWFLFDIRRG